MGRDELDFRSPLSPVVLALLAEHPMHVYGLHRLMQERGLGQLVNIERRNSVQQAVTRLARDGLVEVDEAVTRGGPPRTIYRVTDSGSTSLHRWLHTELAGPRAEYATFPVAVSLLAFLTPPVVRDLLEERRGRLADELAAMRAAQEEGAHLPPVLLLEIGLGTAMHAAEIDWVDGVIAQIDDGSLNWDPETLLQDSPAGKALHE